MVAFCCKLCHIFLLYCYINLTLIRRADANCNRLFQSTSGLQASGAFEAPSRVSSRPFNIHHINRDTIIVNTNGSSMESAFNKPMHCVYKFVANPDEKVAINFTSFKLRGDEPECRREYVDIYIKLKSDDNLETTIDNELPNGRFCTSIAPHGMISLHNVILLIIYSDLDPPADGEPLFMGTYEFVKLKLQDQIGSPEDGTLCMHTIYSTNKREGEFHSLTYPGAYVKNLRCSYKFVGEPNHRVRLEFLDLDLYSGGSHCPVDSIRIFDGLNESDQLIHTICGSHRSLIVYSTSEHLLVTFTTIQRVAELQNRGFSAFFEFSDKFFDPKFIQSQNAKHIRGSECDHRIVSQKGTRGIIVSPESKYHPNAICRYIFEGLQTSSNYERVLIKFTEFDLKTARSASGALQTSSEAPTSSPMATPLAVSATVDTNTSSPSNSSAEQCPDNYVRLYTGEQKPDQKQDPNDYDYVFCGNEVPAIIESDAASLLIEYNSGTIGSGYFKAEYEFIVDYRIAGIQISDGCNYNYRSDHTKSGTFSSPRHPSWYINDMNCTYTFLTKNDEALLLQFTTFKMSNTFNEKVFGRGEACASEDRIEIYELNLDSNEQRPDDQLEIGTYCGTTTPGPIISYKSVRINFKTNKEESHYGFLGHYNFYHISDLKTNEFVSNCGELVHASPRLRNGQLSSPPTYRAETYEKRNHACSWNITARPSHRIALDFKKFELEGSPLVRGCASASVRLMTNRNQAPKELCGSIQNLNGSAHRYISDGEWLSLTFVSTKHASGSNGFAANWTEIKRTS